MRVLSPRMLPPVRARGIDREHRHAVSRSHRAWSPSALDERALADAGRAGDADPHRPPPV